MTAEHLVFVAFFAGVSACFALLRRHAMSVSSVLDIEGRDRRAVRCSGRAVARALVLAALLPAVVALSAVVAGEAFVPLFAAAGIAVPVAFTPGGVAVWAGAIPDDPSLPPVFAALCLALTGGLAAALRNSAAFVFLAFHAVLAALCLIVDLVFGATVPDRASVTSWVLNTAFFLVMASQFFFAFLTGGTFRQWMASLFSAVLSGSAFALGASVLAMLAGVVDGTSYMLMVYLVLAYGIVAAHVAALSLSLGTRAA
ncbi:hypothetical protein P6F26_10750 [Roseibacterium sp. SDUM158017]|uniref:hypothetical protein n=1 Tax=Roseicyclus salinarum TaxID=3036773 RepID=UPI0024154612|nr:hypothetical protein [Roseibacterium sp. SDUM158017]MDG4648923.1 hypothetical protein [Roseibacterium sp. SDUM158017]